MAPKRGNNERTAYQEVFVAELRARRDSEGLSRNKLAQALGCTPQWLAKVENLEKPPSEGLATDLDTYFRCDGMFHRLWLHHAQARRNSLIPSGFRPLAEVEKEAEEISIYEPLLVTGLVQTEEYARLVIGSGTKADKLDELVAIRMERQEILDKADPPWLFLVFREAALRDIRPEIRKAQCRRLLDLMSRRTVSLQVLPTGASVFVEGAFHLLDLGHGRDVAYVDGAGGYGQMLTEPDDVRRLSVIFKLIRSAALSVEDSEQLIHAIMEDT